MVSSDIFLADHWKSINRVLCLNRKFEQYLIYIGSSEDYIASRMEQLSNEYIVCWLEGNVTGSSD